MTMSFSIQITFRHMGSSPAVEERIREEANQLERYFDGIVSCRVIVEAPHPGHGAEYKVDLHLGMPGSDILVNHSPSLHGRGALAETGGRSKETEAQPDHKDVYVAIRDAFSAARRQLEDRVRVQRRDVKHHATQE
jgi:ribosome-associated translation inhibitor RaiA